MFDYRIARNVDEYTAKLRQEALNDRLVRSASPRLADHAARVFRAWATRLERSRAERADSSFAGGSAFDRERYEALMSRGRHPYPAHEL